MIEHDWQADQRHQTLPQLTTYYCLSLSLYSRCIGIGQDIQTDMLYSPILQRSEYSLIEIGLTLVSAVAYGLYDMLAHVYYAVNRGWWPVS